MPLPSTLLLDDSSDAVVATSGDGTVLFWSSGAKELFGYARDEAMGRHLQDLIIPLDRIEEYAHEHAQAVASGAAVYEAVRRRRDGSPIYASISYHTRRDAGGAPYVISSTSDITDLRVVRDAKLVEARFAALLESMPDGIVVVNLTGRIVYANTQAESIFGYAVGELKGKAIETLLPERYRSGHVGHRSACFERSGTLAAVGHELLLAVDGAEGLEVAARAPVDVILCDLQLPDIDGFEVLRRVRADPALRRVPIVAVTSLAMVGDRDKALVAGFDGYLSKPIEPTTFAREVEAHLSRRKQADGTNPGR